MKKMTSIHVCVAKYGAEKHNRREKEMKHVHPEYSHLNKSWESGDFKSVADEIRKAKERYMAKHFCRKVVVDGNGNRTWAIDPSKPKKMPKTSKPIREGVAVITESTTMEQMQQLASVIYQRFGITTKAIYAHLDEGHERLVTDKDHEKGKYLDVPEGENIFVWNYHAHYIFDWTNHETGRCINLNSHNMSELQDMLANTFKMERGKKSGKKWLAPQSFKAEQEAKRAEEMAEYAVRKQEEVKQADKEIKSKKETMAKLQKAIDDLLSATSVPKESLNAVSFAEMKFKMTGSDKVMTVLDLVDDALRLINEDISTPIPLLKRDEWKKERNAKAKEIVTTLQQQLLSVSKHHKKQINEVGKQMYLDAKQKVAMAARTEEENVRLKRRISELDENAIEREKAKTAKAEKKLQEQSARADREEARANKAENRLSRMEQFIRSTGVTEAFEHWNNLYSLVSEAAKALVAWAQKTASLFDLDEERVIGKGIIAKCQMDGLNPSSETNRQKAATGIADMSDAILGGVSKFKWNMAVTRIGQLASEMNVSVGTQSIDCCNEEMIAGWDVTKKRGLGR